MTVPSPRQRFSAGAACLFSTPLAKGEISAPPFGSDTRARTVTLQQRPALMGTLALRLPLASGKQVELSGSVARSMVRARDDFAQWDVAPATIGNAVVGIGYLYRHSLALRAGVGATRLFAAESSVFAGGTGIRPLLEAGASGGIAAGRHPIEIDVRLQLHTFGTATLQDNGGSDGSVMRAIIQVGTTLWQTGR